MAAGGGGGGVARGIIGTTIAGFLSSGVVAGKFALTSAMGGGTGLIGSVLGLVGKAGAALKAGAMLAAPFAALAGTLLVSERIARRIAQTDKSVLEWREESLRVQKEIAKREETDIKAGDAKIVKGARKQDVLSRGLRALGLADRRFENVRYKSGKAASSEMLAKMTGGIPKDLAGKSASDLNKLRVDGHSVIGLMWSRPDLAADLSKALQERGAEPEAIDGALKLRAAQGNASMADLQRRIDAAKGPGIAERAKITAKEKDKAALAAADKALDERTKMANIMKSTASPQAKAALVQSTFGLSRMDAMKKVFDATSITKPGAITNLSTLSPTQIQAAKDAQKQVAKVSPAAMQQARSALQQVQSALPGSRAGAARSPRAGDIPLKAGVNNMGKLTLTLDNFYELIHNYEEAKTSNLPFGTGVPR